MKNRTFFFMTALAGLLALTGCGGGGVSSSNSTTLPSEDVKDSYEFVYNVNYEGGQNRTVSVNHGQRASNWSAKRSGYDLDNWYETVDLEKPFDFNTAIVKDTTVYAKWNEKIEEVPVSVTFDYNYGDRKPTIVTAYKGQTLAKALVPDPKRLGYSVEGWYTEKALTNQFVFGSTVLMGDITLYANYTDVSNFKYDSNGNIEYDNVSFNLVVNDEFNIKEVFVRSVVTKFNAAYKGKITANVVSQSSTANSDITLKFHQTNVINRSGDYYAMADVLDLAQLSFDEAEFEYYANQDNYKEGKLNSYPVGHIVPALVFNTEKLAQYSPAYAADGTLPSTYEEFYTVMKAFTAGEGTHALVTDESWPFYEGSANLPWSQNGIMPYDFDRDTNTYYTKWETAEGKETAKTAAQAIYEYFGPNSLIKGTRKGDYETNSFIYNRVGQGSALFALTNNNDTLGLAATSGTEVIPVTNLFNKANSAESRNFVGNYSIGITNSGPADLYKVAAAGVFADYFSKNALKLGNQGLVPARKSIQEGEFAKTSNEVAMRLRKVAAIDKMITLPGHWAEYSIFNNMDNGNFDLIIDFDEWDPVIVDSLIDSFADSFKGQIG